MTPSELLALADEATTEGGFSRGWMDWSGIRLTPREKRLALLAPDLARLCAELAEAAQLLIQRIAEGGPTERREAALVSALAKLADLPSPNQSPTTGGKE